MNALGLALMISCLAYSAGPGDALSREACADLVRSLFADVRDVGFRFEGESRRMKQPDVSGLSGRFREAASRDADRRKGHVHQGTWAYRNDLSLHLDVFRRYLVGTVPMEREMACLRRGKFSRRVLVPDLGGPIGPDESTTGIVGSMYRDCSPLMVFEYPDIIQLLTSVTNIQYRFVRWEDFEGSKCLVFEFYLVDKQSGEESWKQRIWLDVERGGHPSRIEKYTGNSLISIVSHVNLVRFQSLDGKPIWFPVSGRQETFEGGAGAFTAPSEVETFELLKGTLRINQGLGDERFSLNWGLDKPRLAKIAARSKKTPRTPRRADAQSTEERLAVALTKAEAEGRAVEAAPLDPWFTRHGVSLTLAGGGIMVFLIAGVLRRRVQ